MGAITDDDVFRSIPIIPQRLTFRPRAEDPNPDSGVFFWSIDAESTFEYHAKFGEFGPPSLAQIHRFYQLTVALLAAHAEPLEFYCLDNAFRFTTAVCYICTFQILHTQCTADEVFEKFSRLEPCFMPFNDASPMRPTHSLSVRWYLRGFQKGVNLKWYSPDTFDLDDWEFFYRGENGSMNWIVPRKLLAFASPWMQRQLPDGAVVCLPSDLIKPFKDKGITYVVRLNERVYNERIFTSAGLRHTDLFFADGTTPPLRIRDAFLRIINGKDVVALHCRAGIGRTWICFALTHSGTLAAVWLINKFAFTGDEAIAWVRICRPGSIMGPQQQYLMLQHRQKAASVSLAKTQIRQPRPSITKLRK
jgi:cell division cycle 14